MVATIRMGLVTTIIPPTMSMPLKWEKEEGRTTERKDGQKKSEDRTGQDRTGQDRT